MKRAYVLAAIPTLLAGLALSTEALAITTTATADLHLRTGPASYYPVITTIGRHDQVEVHGCLKDKSWCDVTWQGARGWASADYLAYGDAAEGIEVLSLADDVSLPVASYTEVSAVEPVGEVVAVEAGAEVLEITPPMEISAYVSEQTVEPVFVTGEIVVGAVLPETVPLYAIPDYEYQFTHVNQRRVLVDPAQRTIVYIYS